MRLSRSSPLPRTTATSRFGSPAPENHAPGFRIPSFFWYSRIPSRVFTASPRSSQQIGHTSLRVCSRGRVVSSNSCLQSRHRLIPVPFHCIGPESNGWACIRLSWPQARWYTRAFKASLVPLSGHRPSLRCTSLQRPRVERGSILGCHFCYSPTACARTALGAKGVPAP